MAISNVDSAVQLDSVFGVAIPSQPEVSDSCTMSGNVLALEVWLRLSAAEFSDGVVHSEEIKLKLAGSTRIALLGWLFNNELNCTAGMVSLNSELSTAEKHKKWGGQAQS